MTTVDDETSSLTNGQESEKVGGCEGNGRNVEFLEQDFGDGLFYRDGQQWRLQDNDLGTFWISKK
jgi:hypothetical protein